MKKIILLSVTLALAGPIENLKPGEWYMAPNSHLDAIDPEDDPAINTDYPNSACWHAVEGLSALMNDWSGGAFDTKRNRLMVWGGGHCGYAGNEIYAFSMDSLKWSRLTLPTQCQYIDLSCGPTWQTYGDSTPSSRHAYDGLEYLPDPVDGFFTSGGALWGAGGPGGTGGSGTWIFKIATGQWEHKASAPDGRNGNETAYDPVSGHLFQRGNCWLAEYNPLNNTWTNKYNGGSIGCFWSYDGSGEIDPKRGLMVFTGNGSDAWGVYNLKTGQYSRPSTTGDNSIQSQDGGLAYDPKSDRIVAWNGGANVYTLNPDSWTWTRMAPASTNTVVPTAGNSNGTFGRFRYVPSKNVFVGVNATNQNVYVYRLTAGAGTGEEESAYGGQGQKANGKGRNQIQISPNPVTGGRVVIGIGHGASAQHMFLYDVRGRRIAEFSEAKDFIWDASRFPAGIYTLRATRNGQSITQRISVIR